MNESFNTARVNGISADKKHIRKVIRSGMKSTLKVVVKMARLGFQGAVVTINTVK